MYLLAKNRGIVSKLLYLNKRHKSTRENTKTTIFCSFLRSPCFCATHLYTPSSKDVQTIGELTNSQWKWLRLLKLHKRSFYSAAIDKKTVEKLLFLSFTAEYYKRTLVVVVSLYTT